MGFRSSGTLCNVVEREKPKSFRGIIYIHSDKTEIFYDAARVLRFPSVWVVKPWQQNKEDTQKTTERPCTFFSGWKWTQMKKGLESRKICRRADWFHRRMGHLSQVYCISSHGAVEKNKVSLLSQTLLFSLEPLVKCTEASFEVRLKKGAVWCCFSRVLSYWFSALMTKEISSIPHVVGRCHPRVTYHILFESRKHGETKPNFLLTARLKGIEKNKNLERWAKKAKKKPV